MRNFIIFSILLFSITAKISAQSNEIKAQSAYLNADESYGQGKFQEATNYLKDAKAYLGKTNSKIQYLLVKSLKEAGKYAEAKQELTQYFNVTPEKSEDEKYQEMVRNIAIFEKVLKEEQKKTEEEQKQKAIVEEQKAVFSTLVNDILEKNIAAIGGAERIHAVKTIQSEQTMNMHGNDITVKASTVVGQAHRTEVTVMGIQIITTFNGKQGWTLNPMSGETTAQPMSKDQLIKQKAATYLNGTELLVAKDNNYPVELVRKENQNGKDVFVLKVARASEIVTYYVDQNNYRVVSYDVFIDNNGQPDRVNYTYSNYTTTDGLTLPISVEMNSSATGHVTIKQSKLVLNPRLNNNLFDVPQ